MSRYVDAENLKNAKCLIADNPYAEGWNDAIDAIVECEPTANVRENVHGEWIDTGSGQECSVCKEVQYGYDNFRNYCPNCGCEMRKGEKNELPELRK